MLLIVGDKSTSAHLKRWPMKYTLGSSSRRWSFVDDWLHLMLTNVSVHIYIIFCWKKWKTVGTTRVTHGGYRPGEALAWFLWLLPEVQRWQDPQPVPCHSGLPPSVQWPRRRRRERAKEPKSQLWAAGSILTWTCNPQRRGAPPGRWKSAQSQPGPWTKLCQTRPQPGEARLGNQTCGGAPMNPPSPGRLPPTWPMWLAFSPPVEGSSSSWTIGGLLAGWCLQHALPRWQGDHPCQPFSSRIFELFFSSGQSVPKSNFCRQNQLLKEEKNYFPIQLVLSPCLETLVEVNQAIKAWSYILSSVKRWTTRF